MEQNTKVEGNEKTLKSQIKTKWDKLTDNDVNEAEKNMEMLSGKVQKAYGRTKEVVDQEVSEFRKSLPKVTAPAR